MAQAESQPAPGQPEGRHRWPMWHGRPERHGAQDQPGAEDQHSQDQHGRDQHSGDQHSPDQHSRDGAREPRGTDSGARDQGGQPDAAGTRGQGRQPDAAGALGQSPVHEPQGESEGTRRRQVRLEHPVVTGYDGSVSSRRALAYATGMARRLGRPLLIVHVCPAGVYCEPLTGQVVGVRRDRDELENWLIAEFDQVADRTGVKVCVLARRGNPARELAATATEHGADALVIGASARRWRHLAGSVPGWLARHANCPVTVVP
jgi:nucleotide-binding universal stress UspA family protein